MLIDLEIYIPYRKKKHFKFELNIETLSATIISLERILKILVQTKNEKEIKPMMMTRSMTMTMRLQL